MNRTPVDSSCVVSIGYDVESMTLEIEFIKGTVYQYFDVPEAIYQELMVAESIGRYLNNNIKDNYRVAQL